MRIIDKIELFTLYIDAAKARKFRANNKCLEKIESDTIYSCSALAEKPLI